MKKQILVSMILLNSILNLIAQTRVPDDGISPIWYYQGNVGIGTSTPNSKLVLWEGTDAMSVNYGGLGFNRNVNDGQIFNILKPAWQLQSRDDRFTLEGYNGANHDLLTVLKNGNIGVGTITPYAAMLHVNKPVIGDIGGSIMLTNTASATIGSKVRLGFDLAFFDDIIATASIDARLSNLNGSTDLIFNAFDGSPSLNYYERMRILGSNGNVGIGTATPAYKLDVCGTIRAKEVKIDLQGTCPDFVFKNDYNLMDLKELESFVKINYHLPEIASEKEMSENGVNMNELQMKLLQKVEELTLYIIEQNSKTEALEKELHELRSALNMKL